MGVRISKCSNAGSNPSFLQNLQIFEFVMLLRREYYYILRTLSRNKQVCLKFKKVLNAGIYLGNHRNGSVDTVTLLCL